MSTPGRTRINKECSDLLDQWFLGELDEKSRASMVELLGAHVEFRRAYLEAVCQEALMRQEFPEEVIQILPRREPWYRRTGFWMGAAAAIALASLVVLWRPGLPSTPEDGVADHGGPEPVEVPAQPSHPAGTLLIQASPVARVTQAHEARVNNPGEHLRVGDLLPPGELRLASGSVELTFFSGAKVNLQGPCVFHLKSDFRAALSSGRMTAEVPEQAIGFTVHTPTGLVRDLGTAFALDVKQNGVSDIHVLDGKVEASPRDSSSVVLLSGNQASRLAAGKLTPIRFQADGWPHRPARDDSTEMPPSVHWSFDRFQMGETLDESGVHPLWTRTLPDPGGSRPPRIESGIRGNALSFNGRNEYAESSYRGVSGNKARSVSLWVRIPPDAAYTYPNGIVSWGSFRDSKKWQVCWNNGDQGTVGALRVEFGNGYLIGTTDLRDGLWHHLAVVFLGGSGSDVASHVKLYVDGRLETLSGRRSQFIRTDTESPGSIAVTLGKWLGNWPEKEPFFFRGSVDEVRIFEQALSPGQIAVLATVPSE